MPAPSGGEGFSQSAPGHDGLIRLVVVLLVVFGLVLPWLGLFHHREYGEWFVFLKHRPSLKFLYRAPLGLGDIDPSRVDPQDLAEDRIYEEFVETGGGFRRSFFIRIPGV